MLERKKVSPLPFALLFTLSLVACAVEPNVPVVYSSTLVTTTTTTVRPPVIVVTQAPPVTTTTTTTTTIALPSIREPELRNLYGDANLAYQEVISYGIAALLPDEAKKAIERFSDAEAYFGAEICRLPFDGVEAYPVAAMLQAAQADLFSLLERGLPLAADVERSKTSNSLVSARASEAGIESPDRFDAGVAELILASDLQDANEYREAIASYRRATTLFASAGIKSKVERLRKKVIEGDYAGYSPHHSGEADKLVAEEQTLYAAATDTSIAEGLSKLELAQSHYTTVIAWGDESRAAEAKSAALIARRAADSSTARLNASEEYEAAATLFAEGENLRKGEDFAGAQSLYEKANSGFMKAHESAAAAKSAAKVALELAQEGLNRQKALIEAAAFEEDVNFEAAASIVPKALDEFANFAYEASRIDSFEALNQVRISELLLNGRIQEARSAEMALAEVKRESDRVLAEAALAAAKAEIDRAAAGKADVERQLAEAKVKLAEAGRLAADRLASEISLTKASILVHPDQEAFSPNGDSVKDTLSIDIQAPIASAIKERDIAIYRLDAAGNRQAGAMRTWPSTIESEAAYIWDGRTNTGSLAPDGDYQALLRLSLANDEVFFVASPAFKLISVGPKIAVSASFPLFSPNGDGKKDALAITQDSSICNDWVGQVRNAEGKVMRTWAWKNKATSFVWDGRDASGAIAPDGTYSYEVSATDIAGNTALARIPAIMLDSSIPLVSLTASGTIASPDRSGATIKAGFTLSVEKRDGVEAWKFSILDAQGAERRVLSGSGSDIPARFLWDGRDESGAAAQGQYIGKLIVTYSKGDVVQASSLPVRVEMSPPTVAIKTSPAFFSPDGDGENDTLAFAIDAKAAAGIAEWKLEVFETAAAESNSAKTAKPARLLTAWSGKGQPPATIVWDGKSANGELVESASGYPFTITVRDAVGKSATATGSIMVDVLVIWEGDQLKIRIPSIEFRANYADFGGLSSETIAKNEAVVARIAQILGKFPDYRIRIEGHANSVSKILGYSQSKIQSEETKELIPLSAARAALVRAMLIQNGIDVQRLSVVGLGSSKPVVSFADAENRWKNRRVEFVLIKKK